MTDSPKRVRVAVALLAGALALAGLCYSSWILEFVLPIDIDPVNTFLSELDAVGKPYRAVFATADKIVGVLLVPAAIAGLLLFARLRWSTIGWVALLCFGAATIADAMLPLHDCVPTPKTTCGGPRALFPQLHEPHALSSSLAVCSIAVAGIAFSVAAFRYRRWALLRTVGTAILVLGTAATVWMMVADDLSGHYALGIAQRIQVGAISLWLIVFGIAVTDRSERVSSARP
ncbi:DUF998 domain-containing protein [Nocardia callitridis]|uniref:DUF998 domain-containing protein n=1 Tax=Nocardia callitridis TaxID=648753 RepID=A0ABP9JV95_9NOCA